MGFGHERSPTFLSVDDELNLVTVEVKAIQHRQITLARHTKRVGDTLFDQTLHQQVATNLREKSGIHACIVPTNTGIKAWFSKPGKKP
jgi:hypothetical protein